MYGLAHTGISMFVYGGAAVVAGIGGVGIKLVEWFRQR